MQGAVGQRQQELRPRSPGKRRPCEWEYRPERPLRLQQRFNNVGGVESCLRHAVAKGYHNSGRKHRAKRATSGVRYVIERGKQLDYCRRCICTSRHRKYSKCHGCTGTHEQNATTDPPKGTTVSSPLATTIGMIQPCVVTRTSGSKCRASAV